MTDSLNTIAAEIENLSPANQLRLAANMLESQEHAIADAIVRRVSAELGAVMVLIRARNVAERKATG